MSSRRDLDILIDGARRDRLREDAFRAGMQHPLGTGRKGGIQDVDRTPVIHRPEFVAIGTQRFGFAARW